MYSELYIVFRVAYTKATFLVMIEIILCNCIHWNSAQININIQRVQSVTSCGVYDSEE